MLTLSWSWRNRSTQADIAIDWFAPSIAPEPGQQVIVEWSWRASLSDPLGAPRIDAFNYPASEATYAAPADGWVHIKAYSLRDGLTSWQAPEGDVFVLGGEPAVAEVYTDEADDPYTDENGEPYEGY